MSIQEFSTLPQETQDALVAAAVSGDVIVLLEVVLGLIRETHDLHTAAIKRLTAASPTLALNYAILQSGIANCAELEAFFSEILSEAQMGKE